MTRKNLTPLKDEAKRRIDILNIAKNNFHLGTNERKSIERKHF
jgi:hypothetical protein